ncbi:MAG: pyridoxal-phosphate dependent enzyme [Deltaproteobacteria bacterium]|nr:pyridoxal-phosphate dependent enzyme [Deltaproteobacteria bacterium]
MYSPLLELCPRLGRALRPLPLVEGPTAVEPLARLSARLGRGALWIKRDDRTSPEYGGNKPRKLAWLLAQALARGRRSLVTAGAIGSHHAVATSLFGRRAGLRVCALLTPQPVSPGVQENLVSHVALGTEVRLVQGTADLPTALARELVRKALGGERPMLVLPGGSSPLGTLGFVEAGLELAEQVRAGACPRPGAVVVALGSGGTAAGLALGLALAGLDVPIVGVRVVPRSWLPPVLPRLLAQAAAALLARHGLPSALRAAMRLRLELDDSQLGPGYGHATTAALAAIERLQEDERVELEPTYTGKAAAAFLARAAHAGPHDGPLLLWHTFSSTPGPGRHAEPATHLRLPSGFHRFFGPVPAARNDPA